MSRFDSTKTKRSKLRVAFAVVLAAAIVIGIVSWIDSTPEAEPQSATPSADVLLGNFYDWNVAKLDKFSNASWALMSERLFDLGADGRYAYRLGAALDVNGPVAKVRLKDGIKWSDEQQLTADHVVDAWQRLRAEAARDPAIVEGAGDPSLRTWLATIEVKPTGKLTFEVTGYATVEELSRFIRSRFLMPIRKDLLEKEGGGKTAWLVTVGRYRLTAIPPATLAANAKVDFLPNPVYYDGVAVEPVFIDVAQQNPAPVGDQPPKE